jgi:glycosyltransferase involved in cell wall biosynthesis
VTRAEIIYFSPIGYEHLFQRPQHLYTIWKRTRSDMYDFFYVDPPIFTTLRYITEHLRYVPDLLRGRRASREHDKDPNRIIGWINIPVEMFGFSLFGQVNKHFMRVALNTALKSPNPKIAIVGSGFWEPYISKDDFDLICYDYLDPIGLVSRHPDLNKKTLQHEHEKLIAKSDIIFVTAELLKEDARSIAYDTEIVMVANGVDVDFFEHNKSLRATKPSNQRKKKRVGYMGTYDWVDIHLISKIAQHLTDVDFLLIGLYDEQVEQYRYVMPDNVFLPGRLEPYARLPACVNTFDVGLIPFKTSPITDAIDPVKLYEYFALGKPVVATDLRQLRRYNDGSLLRVANTVDEFVDAITFFLKHDSEVWRESRRDIARQNSWLSKATIMMDNIESKLTDRRYK